MKLPMILPNQGVEHYQKESKILTEKLDALKATMLEQVGELVKAEDTLKRANTRLDKLQANIRSIDDALSLSMPEVDANAEGKDEERAAVHLLHDIRRTTAQETLSVAKNRIRRLEEWEKGLERRTRELQRIMKDCEARVREMEGRLARALASKEFLEMREVARPAIIACMIMGRELGLLYDLSLPNWVSSGLVDACIPSCGSH